MGPFIPPYAVDSIGYPLDPQLRELQGDLGNLAADLRNVSRGIDGQESIVKDYHAIMNQLYALGWDDLLDYEAELPDHLMPPEYLIRHPRSR
jgi:hypothetical protein